jgi:ADP-ribose pyrophosphatase
MKPTPPPLPLDPGDQLLHHGSRADFILRPIPTTSGKPIVREVCLHPGAVIILAVADDDRIVMIRNRRHTVHETLLELPAGTLERDAAGITEDPAGCAARELTEETGYVAGRIAPFGWFYTSPGILTEKMYAFLATGIKPGPQHLEDTEQIQVELLRSDEILTLIHENRIVDAKSIATLLKYLVRSPRTP